MSVKLKRWNDLARAANDGNSSQREGTEILLFSPIRYESIEVLFSPRN
jgi:hypothetical protein